MAGKEGGIFLPNKENPDREDSGIHIFSLEGKPRNVGIIFSGHFFPGMGKEFGKSRTAEKIYRKAHQAVGYDIRDFSFDKGGSYLKPGISEIAAYVYNHICYSLAGESPQFSTPKVLAGRDIGFYNALVASGAISFEEGLKLVIVEAENARKMHDQYKGRLVAKTLETAKGRRKPKTLDKTINELKEKGFHVESVGPEGEIEIYSFSEIYERNEKYLRRLESHGTKVTSRRAERPTHLHTASSPRILLEALGKAKTKDAVIPVIAGTTGELIQTELEIRQEIINQSLNMIRWDKVIETLEGRRQLDSLEMGHEGILSKARKNKKATVALIGVSAGVAFALAYGLHRFKTKKDDQ
ncbi:MAG: hypothetical protein Q8P89_04190 [bacterium]|nr:hypothetical protein [bacterium]